MKNNQLLVILYIIITTVYVNWTLYRCQHYDIMVRSNQKYDNEHAAIGIIFWIALIITIIPVTSIWHFFHSLIVWITYPDINILTILISTNDLSVQISFAELDSIVTNRSISNTLIDNKEKRIDKLYKHRKSFDFHSFSYEYVWSSNTHKCAQVELFLPAR